MRRFLPIVVLSAAAYCAAAVYGFAAMSQDICDFSGRPENALEQRLFADAADGRLDEHSPLIAALVASGVDSADMLREYERKAKLLADKLRHSCNGDDSSRRRVEMIFDFMHRRVLRGYDLGCTDLRLVIDEGRFNCVSATVLFNYLADELGFDCRGLEMPSHAMSRVVLADGAIDVETTCPGWFHLAENPQKQAIAASKTIGTAALADRTKAREVTPIQLAAMIYYNRGVDLLAAKRFAEAAAANAKSLRLDPTNAIARGNLLATINNWSIHLGDGEQFAEAVDLLRRGLAIDAKFEPFAQNFVHVHHQWVEVLSREGRFEEAAALLSRATAEMPQRDYLRRAQAEVMAHWAKATADSRQAGPLLSMPCVHDAGQVD